MRVTMYVIEAPLVVARLITRRSVCSHLTVFVVNSVFRLVTEAIKLLALAPFRFVFEMFSIIIDEVTTGSY